MIAELRCRNFAESTIQSYVRAVEQFSRYFHCSPHRLGPAHVRQYQAMLFTHRKLASSTVTQHLAALRFLYVKVLNPVRELASPNEPSAPPHKWAGSKRRCRITSCLPVNRGTRRSGHTSTQLPVWRTHIRPDAAPMRHHRRCQNVERLFAWMHKCLRSCSWPYTSVGVLPSRLIGSPAQEYPRLGAHNS